MAALSDYVDDISGKEGNIMIKLSVTDTVLLEKQLEVLKRNCACPDGFNYELLSTSDSTIFISFKVVTYDGEVYQKDLYLPYLLSMTETSLKRYALSYLK